MNSFSSNNLLNIYYSPDWFYKPYGCIEWYILWWRDITDPTFYINICKGIDGYGSSGGGTDSSSSANGPSLYKLLTCIYLITAEIDILNLYLTYISIFYCPSYILWVFTSCRCPCWFIYKLYCVYAYDLYYWSFIAY